MTSTDLPIQRTCKDYAILASVQGVLVDASVESDRTVFISGIGCSSRYPYYMTTYGMHSIHGRAPAIATKGQYSPTSQLGQVTKTSPMGVIDTPFNPVSLALGTEESFVVQRRGVRLAARQGR